MKFYEFAQKFYIDKKNIGGTGTQALFIGRLFHAAGSNFFPTNPGPDDDVSYQGKLFRGKMDLSPKIKSSFPDRIDEEAFISYFESRINDETVIRIANSFKIKSVQRIKKSILLRSLCRQFKKFVAEPGDSTENIVAREYSNAFRKQEQAEREKKISNDKSTSESGGSTGLNLITKPILSVAKTHINQKQNSMHWPATANLFFEKKFQRKIIPISSDRLTCCEIFNGLLLMAGFDGFLYFLEIDSVKIEKYKISSAIIRCLCVFDNYLAIGDDDGYIYIFNLTKKEIISAVNTTSAVFCIIYEKKANKLYSSGRNGNVTEWEFQSDQRFGLLENRLYRCSDSSIFTIINHNQTILFADSKGCLGQIIDPDNPFHFIEDAIFCTGTCGQNIFMGCANGKILTSNIDSYSLTEFGKHKDCVRNLLIIDNNNALITVSKDKQVRLWDLTTAAYKVISTSNDYVYDICGLPDDNKFFVVDGRGELTAIY